MFLTLETARFSHSHWVFVPSQAEQKEKRIQTHPPTQRTLYISKLLILHLDWYMWNQPIT